MGGGAFDVGLLGNLHRIYSLNSIFATLDPKVTQRCIHGTTGSACWRRNAIQRQPMEWRQRPVVRPQRQIEGVGKRIHRLCPRLRRLRESRRAEELLRCARPCRSVLLPPRFCTIHLQSTRALARKFATYRHLLPMGSTLRRLCHRLFEPWHAPGEGSGEHGCRHQCCPGRDHQ
jgi:hypothetical protein